MTVIKYMRRWDDFLNDLALIETKYWRHFRNTKLSDHYILNEDESQSLRFAFKEESDLPQNIKAECMELFMKHQSNQKGA